MRCLRLQVDSMCLGHTWAFRNLLCSVHQIQSWIPKHYFVSYLVILLPWLFIFQFQISEMLNTIHKLFWLAKFHAQKCSSCLVHLKGDMAPKMYFCPYLVIMWSWSKFQKCLTLPHWGFLVGRVAIWYIWMELWPKNACLAIFDHVVTFRLLTSIFQKCLTLTQ